MEYRDFQPVTREIVEQVLIHNNPAEICKIIVDATHFLPDYAWLEHICIRLLDHPDINVKGVALTCLGHLARLHRELDLVALRAALTNLYEKTPSLDGRIQDVMDDIKVFMIGNERNRDDVR